MSQVRIPRKFQGVWIPASLWLDHFAVDKQRKVMLVEISSLENDVPGCWYATNAHFAAFFGLSVSRVSEIISRLAERGWSRLRQDPRRKRVIERHPHLQPFDEAEDPFGKRCEPLRKRR